MSVVPLLEERQEGGRRSSSSPPEMRHQVGPTRSAACWTAAHPSAEFQELPGEPPESRLVAYIPSVESQSATSLPPPNALAWLTGKLESAYHVLTFRSRTLRLSTIVHGHARDLSQAEFGPVSSANAGRRRSSIRPECCSRRSSPGANFSHDHAIPLASPVPRPRGRHLKGDRTGCLGRTASAGEPLHLSRKISY